MKLSFLIITVKNLKIKRKFTTREKESMWEQVIKNINIFQLLINSNLFIK